MSSDLLGLRDKTAEILARLGVTEDTRHGDLTVRSPITGGELARLASNTSEETEAALAAAAETFDQWRAVPAPVRGSLVREFGMLLRTHKADLGTLVSIEVGKIPSEGLGEVQEMIDICDLASGLSRQLFGLTIASERPGHRLAEQWHPLGIIGVISAFNFPAAVWSWNAAIALVCGDVVVWKPSEKAPLTALACHALLREAGRRVDAPAAVSSILLGRADVGQAMVDDPRVALVSATGSTRMGRIIAPRVAARFGRILLELGGNNAAVVAPSADLELAVRAIVFSAVGTSGQRCTTLRRVIAHASIIDELTSRLTAAYGSLPIGSPLEGGTLVGPLIDREAYEAYLTALSKAQADGGEVLAGGRRILVGDIDSAYYVEPALIRMPAQTSIVRHETFAPILYILSYGAAAKPAEDDLDQAIAMHNGVGQGLSSSIFTLDVREAERFTSAEGSDCGIVNVNIGTSGAEIGGAFGGEKETGGGRESGSDAWKAYMRRATNTVNYSNQLPLAQGVEFL